MKSVILIISLIFIAACGFEEQDDAPLPEDHAGEAYQVVYSQNVAPQVMSWFPRFGCNLHEYWEYVY